MALMVAGYWPTTYFPESYWPTDYWPEAAVGTVHSIAGVIAMQLGFDGTMGVGNKAVVVDEHIVNEFRFPPIPASAPEEIVEYVEEIKVFLNELRLELENQFSSDYHIPGALYVDGNISVYGSVLASVIAKTANYTATAKDNTIVCGSGDETFTISLPAPVKGKTFYIKNVGGGVITVDADAVGSTTIDDDTTQTVDAYDCLMVCSDGSVYWGV